MRVVVATLAAVIAVIMLWCRAATYGAPKSGSFCLGFGLSGDRDRAPTQATSFDRVLYRRRCFA
jgi:hypothetical protein